MNNENIASYQIDNETGEVINTWYYDDSVKTIRKASKDYLKQTEEINKGKKFTMIYDASMQKVFDLKLKPTTMQVLYYMIAHIGHNNYSGLVIKEKNRCFYGAMNGKEIQAKVNCKDTAFNNAIRELKDNGIITTIKALEGRGNNFLFNPYIATHDKRVPKELIKLFQNTIFNYSTTSYNDSTELQEEIIYNEEIQRHKEKKKEQASHYWGEPQEKR